MISSVFNLDSKKNLIILVSDIVAIVAIMFLPAISHLMPFPLYYLDPMRLVLLGVYFVSRNNKNAYLLALGLPIFSMLYSGHPVFYKAILISIELFINMVVLHFLFRKGANIFYAVFLSIILSKIMYYLFKFAFIEWSLISGKLFSTSLIIQLMIATGLSAVFFIFGRRFNQS